MGWLHPRVYPWPSKALMEDLLYMYAKLQACEGCIFGIGHSTRAAGLDVQAAAFSIILTTEQQWCEGYGVVTGVGGRRLRPLIRQSALDDAPHASGLQSPLAPQAPGYQDPCQAICCAAGSCPEAGPCGTVSPCRVYTRLVSSHSFVYAICMQLN